MRELGRNANVVGDSISVRTRTGRIGSSEDLGVAAIAPRSVGSAFVIGVRLEVGAGYAKDRAMRTATSRTIGASRTRWCEPTSHAHPCKQTCGGVMK